MGFNRFQRAVLSDYDEGSHQHILECDGLKDTSSRIDPAVYHLVQILENEMIPSCLDNLISPMNEIDAALHLMEALDLEIASRQMHAGVVHERRLHTDPK
jgi:hypothetical protein